MKRHREHKRDVTVTAQNRTDQNRTEAVTAATGYYAKADREQLAAWDRYNIAQTGRSLPRDRFGGWRVASEWPPIHALTGRTA